MGQVTEVKVWLDVNKSAASGVFIGCLSLLERYGRVTNLRAGRNGKRVFARFLVEDLPCVH